MAVNHSPDKRNLPRSERGPPSSRYHSLTEIDNGDVFAPEKKDNEVRIPSPTNSPTRPASQTRENMDPWQRDMFHAITGLAARQESTQEALSNLVSIMGRSVAFTDQIVQMIPQSTQQSDRNQILTNSQNVFQSVNKCNGLDPFKLLVFLEQVDKVLPCLPLTDGQICNLVARRCEGPLLRWWLDRLPSMNSWPDTKYALIHEYLTFIDRETLIIQLVCRRQRFDEDLAEFIEDIYSKAKLLAYERPDSALVQMMFNNINAKSFNAMRFTVPPANIEEFRILARQTAAYQRRFSASAPVRQDTSLRFQNRREVGEPSRPRAIASSSPTHRASNINSESRPEN